MERCNDIAHTNGIAAQSGVGLAPASRAVTLLQQQVRGMVATAPSRTAEAPYALQLRVPVEKTDALAWLSAQSLSGKLFWESRDKSFWSAGVGIADRVVGDGNASVEELKQSIESKLKRTDDPVRYYGGLRFDFDYEANAEDSSFKPYRFVLPRFELQFDNDAYALCCNLLLPRDLSRLEEIVSFLKQLKFGSGQSVRPFPLPLSRADWPVEAGWRSNIQKALGYIRNGHALEKVVLARKAVFSFASSFDKLQLFQLLRNATPSCFHFFFQLGDDEAFLGAPPERLYRRRGRSIESEAVAGTGQRGLKDVRDTELGQALLMSEKDQREHAYVRHNIERVFEEICTSTEADPKPKLMNLSVGRHLRSRYHGLLHEDISDIDILSSLPPTAAVGGHPKQLAIQTIRELESFDRGWYAGPVGWLGRDEAEFAVAIRSGLAAGKTLSLYSGAGIVDGSEPAAEWAEIEQKIGDFIKALGLDQKGAKY